MTVSPSLEGLDLDELQLGSEISQPLERRAHHRRDGLLHRLEDLGDRLHERIGQLVHGGDDRLLSLFAERRPPLRQLHVVGRRVVDLQLPPDPERRAHFGVTSCSLSSQLRHVRVVGQRVVSVEPERIVSAHLGESHVGVAGKRSLLSSAALLGCRPAESAELFVVLDHPAVVVVVDSSYGATPSV
jgi:hypothetical protein